MDWGALFRDHLDVLVTGLVGLVGILGAIAGAVTAARAGLQAELAKQERQWQKERYDRLAGAVEAHLDRMLQLMHQAYWAAQDDKEARPESDYELRSLRALEEHRELEGVARARIEALGRKDLDTLFGQLSYQYGLFRQHYGEHNLTRAFDDMRTAQAVAGKLLARMYASAEGS